MQIVINRKKFIDDLNMGSSMAGKSKTNPIQNNTRIVIKDNGAAFIYSFDGETSVEKRTSVISSQGDCDFCIMPKDILGVLSNIRDENVNLNLNDTSIEVEYSSGSITLPVLSSEEFILPVMTDVITGLDIENTEEFCSAIGGASAFCGSDEIRPILTGICLRIKNDTMTVAASDSHALYIEDIQVKTINYEDEAETETVIPNRATRPLLGMLNKNDRIKVLIGKTNVVFKGENETLSCRMIVGKYPEVKRLIPQTHNLIVEVDKENLTESIDRTLLAANATTQHLKLNIRNGGVLEINSEDLGYNKKATDSIPCTVNGDLSNEFIVGVKGSLLASCLSAISSKNVTFKFIDGRKAILILDADNTNKNIILMPVMLS